MSQNTRLMVIERETGLKEDGLCRGEIRQVVRSEERGGLGAEYCVGSNGEPLNGRGKENTNLMFCEYKVIDRFKVLVVEDLLGLIWKIQVKIFSK